MIPIVSIVIATYNKPDILANCLNSLMTQQAISLDEYEIIVVDNASTDNTQEIIHSFMQQMPNMRFVVEKQRGLSYALNSGAQESNGNYLVFLDHDTIVPDIYVSQVIRVLGAKKPHLCGGPLYPYYTSPKPTWFKDAYEVRKYEQTSCFSTTCRITGANFIIKKSVFDKLGAFDVSFYHIKNYKNPELGNDAKVLDLYRKQTPLDQQRVYYALECWVYHHVPDYKMTFWYIAKRSFSGGKLTIELLRMHYGGSSFTKEWALVFVRLKKLFCQHDRVIFVRSLATVCGMLWHMARTRLCYTK